MRTAHSTVANMQVCDLSMLQQKHECIGIRISEQRKKAKRDSEKLLIYFSLLAMHLLLTLE